VQALVQRYLEKMAVLNETIFTADAIYVPTPILFGRAVDALVAFVDRYQGFHLLLSTPWISPEIQAVADDSTAHMIAEIEKIILGKAPRMDETEAHVAAEVLMHMIKGMLLLVEAAHADHRPAVVREFKRMDIAYLTTLSGQSSAAPPPGRGAQP
jgi:AcrR family transcriptional regulator